MMIWNWFTKKRSLCLCLLISLQYYGAAQRDGFISIDCGASSNYTDPDTGIVWSTDESYERTGTNQIVTSLPSSVNQWSVFNERQLNTLRYFLTNRSKHCYTLPASNNSAYLLRFTFLNGRSRFEIGNKFHLSIDSEVVEGFDWSRDHGYYFRTTEYVVAAGRNRLNVCLLPEAGFACISTLELRPLVDGMYNAVLHGRYLRTLKRVNCGAQSEDPPIRIWYSGGAEPFNTTNTTSNISVDVADKPPLAVMQSAWVSSVTVPLEWLLSTDYFVSSTFYTNHFFAEVQKIGPSDTWIMNIAVNGEDTRNNMSVEAGTTLIHGENMTITSSLSEANYTFSASPESDLGPLLNAFEIFRIIEVKVQSSTDVKDAEALEVVKDSFGLSSWTGDPCLPVPYNWVACDVGTNPRVTKIILSDFNLVGTIPATIIELTALTDLWLDRNKFEGGIPDLSKLTKLRTLHLQNNSLSGSIPSTLASLSLAVLFLSNNNLSGPIPAALVDRDGLDLETSGNVNLCAPTEHCPVLPIDLSHDNDGSGGGGDSRAIDPSGNNGGGDGGGMRSGALISGGVAVALAIIGLMARLYGRKCPEPPSAPAAIRVDDLEFIGTQGSNASSSGSGSAAAAVKKARAFTLSEVQEATQEEKILGKGGFGTVLYGILRDGTEVAVKENSANSLQGTTEFLKEVSVLSRVHHNNLVSLLGYCEENGKRILIYEYMAKGTLREHLHEEGMTAELTWTQRLQIALDAAYGLEYLHNHCIPKNLLHRT